jgi:hypothetical protein
MTLGYKALSPYCPDISQKPQYSRQISENLCQQPKGVKSLLAASVLLLVLLRVAITESLDTLIIDSSRIGATMTSSQSQVITGGTVWTPPVALLSHGGQPLDPKRLFFAPPPAEIGALISAYSSFEQNQSITSKLSNTTSETWMGALMFAVIAGFVPGLLINFIPGAGLIALIVGLGAGLSVLWVMVWASLAPTCSYVGTQGIAKFTLSKDKVVPEMFEFAKAAELRTETTRKYKNNIYQYTTYDYTWSGAEGKETYKLSGLYYNEQGVPPDKNEYTLALAAEKAWSALALERANRDIEIGGRVTFNAVNGDALTLGDGYVEIARRGEQVRLAREDMPKLSVDNGVVTVSSKNTSYNFFGAKGAYKFNYNDIGNAKLFLLLFDTLI